jgi:hypothetical protein
VLLRAVQACEDIDQRAFEALAEGADIKQALAKLRDALGAERFFSIDVTIGCHHDNSLSIEWQVYVSGEKGVSCAFHKAPTLAAAVNAALVANRPPADVEPDTVDQVEAALTATPETPF